MRKYYPSLDICKYICCVLVLVIHTFPFRFNFWLDGGTGLITRFANPSFFAISSFLLFSKINNTDKAMQKNYLLKQLKRILQMYLLWTALYFVILLPENIANGNVMNIGWYISSLLLKGIVNYLWYFPALALGLAVVYLLSKWLKPQIMLIAAVLFLLVGLMFSTYKDVFAGKGIGWLLYDNVFSIITAKNGLFFGFPYCAIGYYFACKKIVPAESIKDRKVWTALALVGVFFICLAAESLIATRKIKPHETYLWLSVFPMIFSLMLFLLYVPVQSKTIYATLRKLSIFIYCFEFIPISCFNKLFDRIGFSAWYRGIVLFVLVFVVTNAVAYGVYQLSRKWKWVGYFF